MSSRHDPAPIPSDLPPGAGALGDVEAALPSGAATPDDGRKKKGGGLTEGDADVAAIPENNLWIVMPSIGLVLFLSALDQTIIATALPTIAEKFNASPSEFSWVATAYQLAMTLLTPVNGRVSDIIGRKPMLYAAIVVFTVFSALCGAAQNITWLIVARAFQGLGGGSIIGLTTMVVSDIVPLQQRGTYQGYMGASWGVAAVLGPIIGGALTQKASWRWCFFINLPTCGIALVLLIFTLKLNPPKGITFAELRRTFDFVGLVLVMAGGALLITGFSWAADHGFNTAPAIAMIVVGGVLLALTVVNSLYTSRNAVIPARMFKTRTTLFFTLASTLHALAFIPSNILLPQFFQGVRGADALQSGIQLLPYAIFVSWSTVVAGQIQSRLRIVRPVVWVGYGMAVLAFGIMYGFFDSTMPLSRQYGLLILPAIGIGLSLSSPLLIMQAAMPLKDMAAVTSAWTLTRSLGGSIGIAVFTAILNTDMRSKFAKVPGFGTEFEVPTSARGYAALHELPDGPTKDAVLKAFSDSFRPVWLLSIVIFAICLAITIPTRAYSLNRGPQSAKSPGDVTPPPEAEKVGAEADADADAQRDVSESINTTPTLNSAASREDKADTKA
ncbi:hypothetical protein Q8F55_005046 [Vanrija albida]|uniref:Major facilitator superfamily (MFS) profile domain-containing protein n=1 Tax=Vanrija albida TaxID=181172 RepID=A0ABR3Q0I8_9TREE